MAPTAMEHRGAAVRPPGRGGDAARPRRGGGRGLLARSDPRQAAEEEVLAVAQTVARSPDVRAALTSADPAAALQPYAESIRRDTGTDFVVVMAPDRTRYSHPDPAQIGRPFIGEIGPALDGKPFTDHTSARSASRSARSSRSMATTAGSSRWSPSASPRRDQPRAARQVPVLLYGRRAVARARGAGSWLLSRRLRRQTHGLGPTRDDPDVRVLRRGAARGTGGAGAADHRPPGGAGQRRGAAACSGCRARRSADRWPDRPAPARSPSCSSRDGTRTTSPCWPATGCWWPTSAHPCSRAGCSAPC